MKQTGGARNASAKNAAKLRSNTGTLLTGDEVKTRLREADMTLKDWAEARGYPYATVSQVVRGINRATYGMGHRIAVELGMKRGAA